MLIVTNEQRQQATLPTFLHLSPCSYCGEELAEYPFILIEGQPRMLFHAPCAIQMAIDVLTDLSPLVPKPQEVSAMAQPFRRAHKETEKGEEMSARTLRNQP